jgi:hypothetical protein
MNRRLLVIIGTVISVFVIAIVGASSISLTGSDSAPGEGTTNAVCATALVVNSVVSTSGTVNVVSRVDVNGDMTQCVGEQMLVEVEREGTTPVWAIYNLTTPISSLGLDLNATTGVFYDTKPTAVSNVLQVNGSRVGPVPVTEFGVITLTIARTWE